MSNQHTFQAPTGTRDLYPADMAVRQHIESIWREVSTNYGFDEIEGPTFEHLALYTAKSGPGIVSELFSFRRAGGETDYALRPEFTPTLARMYAAHARSLPSPTKWFCIPSHFRAERPQRGRLREFRQWNIDIIGDDSSAAEAEVIAVTVGVLKRLGLRPNQVSVRLNDRRLVTSTLVQECGVTDDSMASVLELLDKRDRLPPEEVAKRAAVSGVDLERFDIAMHDVSSRFESGAGEADLGELLALRQELESRDLFEWCTFDPMIVRGLAYYTGTVFEVHESSGAERAVAGGGRYDGLIELFGGPPTPAVGVAMGDVVLRLVLDDSGLLSDAESYLPRPDVFVVCAGGDSAEAAFLPIVARLRENGLHVRHSYKTTRNVGKLLKDASKAHARFALILGEELADGLVTLKDLDRGQQAQVPLASVEDAGVIEVLAVQVSGALA